jgi:hypothetical protein
MKRSLRRTASRVMSTARSQRGAEAVRRPDATTSKIRWRVEHVCAEQKDRMGLFIRTIGIARATMKIGLANLVYNIKRPLAARRGGLWHVSSSGQVVDL